MIEFLFDVLRCQQAQNSMYETAQRVNENVAVNVNVNVNAHASPSVYSLVQRVSTADDPNEPQATDTCSESTPQKPSAESSDRILVDNDLYNC